MEIKNRHWIKLWIKECLTGTVRYDMTAEERGVWYDLLIFAGWNRIPGTISANENVPIPHERIASWLNISTKLLNRCIDKFEKSGRLTIDGTGVIHIANWEKYQFSDYDRQKAYREKKQASDEKPF